MPITRKSALSLLIAQEADHDSAVSHFRDIVLSGRLCEPAQARGVLDSLDALQKQQLTRVADQLARLYHWSPDQAQIFVLSGQPPGIHVVEASIVVANPTALSRVVLTIDPQLTAHQVAAYYQAIRTHLVRGRTRALSQKHLTLAVFAATRPHESWRIRMAAWNEEYPHWSYQRDSNFGRDCLSARRRLLSPRYAANQPARLHRGEAVS